MTRRALLVGSQTAGLSGPEVDVERMRAALSALEFEVRACIGRDARRDGIIASYGELVADTAQGDAAVVYYSGHGGLAPNPDYTPLDSAENFQPRFYQFIVPTD